MQSKNKSNKTEKEILGETIYRLIQNNKYSWNFNLFGSVLQNIKNKSSSLFNSLFVRLGTIYLVCSIISFKYKTFKNYSNNLKNQ